MNVKVKFLEEFKDGNVFPFAIPAGSVVVLTENELARVRSSGGNVEVVEHVIANPLKKVKVEEPADALNPENEINDLENHIPGTVEEVAEVREREAKNKKPKK